jgi:hypothetical protein
MKILQLLPEAVVDVLQGVLADLAWILDESQKHHAFLVLFICLNPLFAGWQSGSDSTIDKTLDSSGWRRILTRTQYLAIHVADYYQAVIGLVEQPYGG